MAVTLNASTTTGLEIASDTSGIVTLRNNGTDALSVSSGNLQFNSGYGSVATAYGCRAWVNFNGTGTVAIRASGNVSSITDNGVGDYTVNFINSMPDVNYSSNVTCFISNQSCYAHAGYSAQTISALNIRTITKNLLSDAPSAFDSSIVTVAIFR